MLPHTSGRATISSTPRDYWALLLVLSHHVVKLKKFGWDHCDHKKKLTEKFTRMALDTPKNDPVCTPNIYQINFSNIVQGCHSGAGVTKVIDLNRIRIFLGINALLGKILNHKILDKKLTMSEIPPVVVPDFVIRICLYQLATSWEYLWYLTSQLLIMNIGAYISYQINVSLKVIYV